MRLELAGVSRRVGSTRILDDISMSVPEGDFCVVIGPTGCGKTSLLRIVDLLDRPSSGRVLLDGVDCTACRGTARTAMRRRMAMVMQRPWMASGSVERNIGLGLAFRGVGRDRELVESVLAGTGLEGMGGRRARTLSGGEMQKVAIARAVVTNPRLLILDEPLNSVDQAAKPDLRALIRRLHRETGITVLMATHDLADALSLSTRVFVMSEGRLLQSGDTDHVFSNPSSHFVASFIGVRNILPVVFDGTTATSGELSIVIASPGSGRGFVSIPPESVTISLERTDSSQRNTFRAVVRDIDRGALLDTVHLSVGDTVIESVVTRESTAHLGLVPGLETWLSFKATSVRILA